MNGIVVVMLMVLVVMMVVVVMVVVYPILSSKSSSPAHPPQAEVHHLNRGELMSDKWKGSSPNLYLARLSPFKEVLISVFCSSKIRRQPGKRDKSLVVHSQSEQGKDAAPSFIAAVGI